jgi:aryl-alcohol dehydrogenase-like predicted oxidoreductase
LSDQLCIGTAQFGMPYGIANNSGQPDMNDILPILELAHKNNIRIYDTAQSYGESESVLGKAFSLLGINAEVNCITKIQPGLLNPSEIIENVDRSIKKLKVDQLYGLLAHRIIDANNDMIQNTVASLKDQGIVKYWGVSVYEPKDALLQLENTAIDIIQVPFNILDRRLLDCNFFEKAATVGKQVFLRSIFLQGLIFLSENQLIERKMAWARPHLVDFKNRISQLDVPLESLVFQAVKSAAPAGINIIGIDHVEQLKRNLVAMQTPVISSKIISDWWTGLPKFPERLLNPALW